MQYNGIDIFSSKAVHEFYDNKWQEFAKTIKGILLSHNPNAKIFFNGGANLDNPRWHKTSTHIEMEDLPTSWGGYNKMSIKAKYFTRITDYYLGMTGNFHKAWGEFGGYKNKDALKCEIAAMMTYGAGSSIGDQFHPFNENGRTNYREYRLCLQLRKAN